MICPNCGKEVNADNNYCNFCGNALFGPRNINLNNPSTKKKAVQNSNIESITGIDINDIAKTVVNTPKEKKKFNLKIFKNKPEIKITTSTFIFLGIILVLIALCFYFVLENHNLRKDNNDLKTIKCPNNKQRDCPSITYGLTDNYTFKVMNNWSYRESVNITIINNENISILVYPSEKGQIDRITADAIANEYKSEGYTNANSSEDIINGHKIMFIKFNASGLSFVDFYYQYDAENIIYGQISSSQSDELLNEDVINVLSSLAIKKRENKTISKAPVTYENIFKLVRD